MNKTISKSVRVSSKGQITIPKILLEELEVQKGQDVLLEFVNGRIQLLNAKKAWKQKLANFKPVSLGLKNKVNFSGTHNDIYD